MILIVKIFQRACLQSLNARPLTVENIFDIIAIAFEQNYSLLKQKCLKFITQNKVEIGAEKLSNFPIEILVSTILSF